MWVAQKVPPGFLSLIDEDTERVGALPLGVIIVVQLPGLVARPLFASVGTSD
jgi:hypothetical protein